MWTHAAGILILVVLTTVAGFAVGGALLGVGTAMVYPTLAAIGDAAHPSWRAAWIGVYRLWRDLGYAAGGLVAGISADTVGLNGALVVVAVLTGASGVTAAGRMRETREPLSEVTS